MTRRSRFMQRWFLTAGMLLVMIASADAQIIESWDVFTALDRSTSVAYEGEGSVIVGTTGGAYRYNVKTGAVRIWRTGPNALLELEVSAVGVNPKNGDIYFGGKGGTLSIFHSTGYWTYVTDIARTNRIQRAIRNFTFRDSTVFISTDFGVALYNPHDSSISDSWVRLGRFSPNTGVNDVLFHGDSVFVASDAGLAIGRSRGRDLADPLNWMSYDTGSYVCGNTALSLALIDGKIAVGTNAGACMYDAGTFNQRSDVGGTVRFYVDGSGAYAVDENNLFRMSASGRFEVATSVPYRIMDVIATRDGSIVVAKQRYGISFTVGDSIQSFAPNGPAGNNVGDIALDRNNDVWLATVDEGISRLRSDSVWTNYRTENFPAIGTNASRRVSADAEGTIWSGTFGDGFYHFIPSEGSSDVIIEHFDEKNSPLTPVLAAGPEYVIGFGGEFDQNGVMWLTNWDNTSATPAPMLIATYEKPDGSGRYFKGFSIYNSNPTIKRQVEEVEVDFDGTKWIASSGSQGLIFFHEGETLDQPGKWGVVSTLHGLTNPRQEALRVDPDGELWIGTPTGAQVLVNPGTVLQEGAAAAIFREVRPLNNIYVRDIEVDALNRKWVATDVGLFVLSSDGSEILNVFTTSNSPITDDQVRSLLSDPDNGYMYAGTPKGLNRIATEAVASRDEPSTITAYPQPFLLPQDERLRMSGLPLNSDVKILGLDGHLVVEFDAPGGDVAFWDGRNRDGAFVATGIYIIAARSPQGETVIGKVAVVRQ